MNLNLIEIWHEMPWAVRGVVIVLSIQAIACIAVVIDRLVVLGISQRKSKGFAKTLEASLQKGDTVTALADCSKAEGSHLAIFMHTGLLAFQKMVDRDSNVKDAADMARRALERKGESVSASLNKGMNILASTGSTAPFVGLLGTVLGILNAFKMISESGSGGIATIGGAIGEALIVTGYGLVVAIPAVLIFNWLSNRIASFESGLVNAGSELVDRLEMGDTAPLQAKEVPTEGATNEIGYGALSEALN